MDKLIDTLIALLDRAQPEQIVLMMMGFIVVVALSVILEVVKIFNKK